MKIWLYCKQLTINKCTLLDRTNTEILICTVYTYSTVGICSTYESRFAITCTPSFGTVHTYMTTYCYCQVLIFYYPGGIQEVYISPLT